MASMASMAEVFDGAMARPMAQLALAELCQEKRQKQEALEAEAKAKKEAADEAGLAANSC